jgi:S-adenosyl methyltransferase
MAGNSGDGMPADGDGHSEVGLDTRQPNVARMWDYYLGGKDNYEADREAARAVLGAAPDVPLAALENREFLRHAIRFLVEEAGIRQFIDIGPGLPTQGNVHQLVRKHTQDARIVYVDHDRVVVTHGRATISNAADVQFTMGDLRNPQKILESSELRELIDLAEPVALCMTLVLHFITEDEDPYGIVEQLSAATCPGSYLVISHVTGDDHNDETLDAVTGIYNGASAPLIMRSRGQIERFFDGFELIRPGLVFLSQWRPSTEYYAGGGTRWAYAGVGRKTGPGELRS